MLDDAYTPLLDKPLTEHSRGRALFDESLQQHGCVRHWRVRDAASLTKQYSVSTAGAVQGSSPPAVGLPSVSSVRSFEDAKRAFHGRTGCHPARVSRCNAERPRAQSGGVSECYI